MFSLSPLKRNILLGVYATGYAVCVKYAYQGMNRNKKAQGLMEDYPHTERLYSTFPSLIVGTLWPILLPFLVTQDLDRQHREAKSISKTR